MSIGLPVYNGERFLEAAVDSLLAQDFADFELLVADNASSDKTAEICERYVRQDPRVRYFSSTVNRGASWNFNRVVAEARGEYFKWAADDDLYDPRFLTRCVEVLDADPDVVVAFTRAVEIDEDDEVFDSRGPVNVADRPAAVLRYRAILFDEIYCYAVFGLIRSAVLRSTAMIGPYTTSDRVLLAELALYGRFVEGEEPYFLHREHPGRSMYAYADDRARMGWFDTTRKGTRSMPRWRLGAEYGRALYRARRQLSVRERLSCSGALAWWTIRNGDALIRELLRGGLLGARDLLTGRGERA